MSDGYINIGTKIDETGLDKGLKNVDDKLKTTEKTTGSTAKSFASLGLKVAAVAGAVKVAADVINDLTDAYKTQIKAETQLESAAKNNPYLDSSSVNVLKEYASEIQSYSTFGDEELIPMMAKLAAAGRTQDQIMAIMTTATDMAASGAFSLDAAVSNLNKSYGGLSGELGESIPEIKNLSAEQLKNGAAVSLLSGRYKGIAAEVAKTTGTAEQLGNAFGDLKEQLGEPFEKSMSPVRAFFTEIISGWTKSLSAMNKYRNAKDAENQGATLDTQQEGDILKGREAELKAQLTAAKATALVASLNPILAAANKLVIENTTKELATITQQLSAYTAKAAAEEKIAKLKSSANAKETAQENETAEAIKTKKDYIDANTKAREESLDQLELQAAAEGRSVTAEEKLTVYAQSYVDLVGNSNGLISIQDQAATSLLSTTREISEEVEKQNALKEDAAELEAKIKEILDGISADDERPESEKMKDLLASLDILYAQALANDQLSADSKYKIWQEYTEKRKQLEENITDTEKEEQDKQYAETLASIEAKLTIANNFATQYADIISSITDIVSQQIEDELTVKEAELEKQYANGTLSAEEYEAAVTAAKKQAAEEQYNIDMWSWGASLLSAAANTALGATQALAQGGGWTGPVLAALVTAAGAAQIAAIIANKPTPPTYATGGIVGGTSYTGDKVQALVNSGEMILNAGQQRNLFDSINSGTTGSSNVQVYNSASNDVNASAQVTEDGVKVMIEKTVSSQMASGRYNKSYKTMQNSIRGTRYTS